MTIDIRPKEHEYELVLSGSWDDQDAVNLKQALASIPSDIRKLGILTTDLDGIPMAGVQVLLAYIRFARSIPKPVHIYYNKEQAPHMKLWGLDRSGWENFFHGR